MQTPQSIKRAGWILLVLGLLLSVGMAVIGCGMARVILHSGEPGYGSYTGNHAFTVWTYTLLGLVFVFGLLSMANGVWQVRYSRKNRVLLVAMLLTAAALIYEAAFMMPEKADAERQPPARVMRTH